MVLALSIRLASTVYAYLYTYAPSNILIHHLRSDAGRPWALPVSAVLAVGYLAATAGLNTIIESGGPGWLNLVALTCAWNAIKFILHTVVEGLRLLGSAEFVKVFEASGC